MNVRMEELVKDRERQAWHVDLVVLLLLKKSFNETTAIVKVLFSYELLPFQPNLRIVGSPFLFAGPERCFHSL